MATLEGRHLVRMVQRIALHADGDVLEELDRLGIKYKIGVGGFFVLFNVAESDPIWPRLEPLLIAWGRSSGISYTAFTAREKRQADLLDMGPTWHWDYPKPERDRRYMEVTYDISEYCHKCGRGAKQIAPFRFRGEPKWGRKHILQVNWVFDEFFVLPEVWEHLFKRYGVGCMPVLKNKTGQPLESVVQLKIDTYATAPLRMGGTPYETCPRCGRVKYHSPRGFFPRFAAPQTGDVFKTQEYFGSGGQAFHRVIVSARLFRDIADRKLKGVDFAPLEKAGDV